mgnify:CR=1 FL=1
MPDESMRERLIREAARLFATNGIKATTVARIEEAVGLRVGSGGVHRYFPTKDDLVRAVLEDQLDKGATTRETVRAWPRPASHEVRSFLEMVGHYALAESEHGREVALIGLREGASLYERFPDLRHRNFELAFTSVADQVREFLAESGETSEFAESLDADAIGFLFMGPLLYHRIIEWLTGETALGITDERLVTQWAALLEPLFRRLLEPDSE